MIHLLRLHLQQLLITQTSLDLTLHLTSQNQSFLPVNPAQLALPRQVQQPECLAPLRCLVVQGLNKNKMTLRNNSHLWTYLLTLSTNLITGNICHSTPRIPLDIMTLLPKKTVRPDHLCKGNLPSTLPNSVPISRKNANPVVGLDRVPNVAALRS